MQNVQLEIKTTQRVNDEDDVTEFSCDATYVFSVVGCEILYDESVILGAENIKTRINVSENCVSIVRNDGNYGNITVETGKRNLCQLHTQYGQIMIGVYGISVVNNLKQNGGNITIEYDIDVNGGLLSRNKVEISVREG